MGYEVQIKSGKYKNQMQLAAKKQTQLVYDERLEIRYKKSRLITRCVFELSPRNLWSKQLNVEMWQKEIGTTKRG